MAGGFLRSRVDPSGRTATEGMDEMDPQMFTVLAARVAIERFDTQDHERPRRPHRLLGSIARLARSLTAPVTNRLHPSSDRADGLRSGGLRSDRGTQP